MKKLMLFGFYENNLSCGFFVYPRSFLAFKEAPRIIKLTGLVGWDVPGADPGNYEIQREGPEEGGMTLG